MFSSGLLWKKAFVLSLAVLLADFTESGAFAGLSDCKSATIDDVKETLEKYSKCLPEMIAEGEKASINSLVWTLQETLDLLRPVQEQFCKQPPLCPRPVAPRNGGLVCVTIDSAQYCKPMCNQGYDFQFLRSSRLYEMCGNVTGFSWTTQFVGGKELAICNPSKMAISGAKSAYFPSNSTCVHTLAFPEAQTEQLNIFLKELAQQGIDGSSRDAGADCIVCGY
uniref:Sushi domain-containing protein n=1 Tax=Malurus cyaneus samueli TaxID=2593467 RepID=A0A8C5TII1_9PASS